MKRESETSRAKLNIRDILLQLQRLKSLNKPLRTAHQAQSTILTRTILSKLRLTLIRSKLLKLKLRIINNRPITHK